MSKFAATAAGAASGGILGTVVKTALPLLLKGLFKKDEPEAPQVDNGDALKQKELTDESDRLRALRRKRGAGGASNLLSLDSNSLTQSTSLLGK